MNTVQPIRDMNTVMDIARYLKQNNERDYVMFTTGIYSGLRVSDILKLRVKDVRGKDYIAMREKKTKKEAIRRKKRQRKRSVLSSIRI